jgi:predicted nucleic acid-binding protein
MESGLIDWRRILGHRQVTDAYLLALAVRNNGRLVTFEQRISLDVVVGAKAENLELVA